MEKLSYDEAREWFWVRTGVWFLPIALVSMMVFFAVSSDFVRPFSTRIWLSVGVGVGSALLGLLAAFVSMQFPWMRRGWRLGFTLNGPACAAIAAVVAFFVCGIALSFLQNKPPGPNAVRAVRDAHQAMIHAAYMAMQFGIGASALWGLVFGSWFALRRDRYFVEPI